MKTILKTLIYGTGYVNVNLLEQGIYHTDIPFLYQADETMDSIIERTNSMRDMFGNSFAVDAYIENLKKCELVEINLQVPTPAKESEYARIRFTVRKVHNILCSARDGMQLDVDISQYWAAASVGQMVDWYKPEAFKEELKRVDLELIDLR